MSAEIAEECVGGDSLSTLKASPGSGLISDEALTVCTALLSAAASWLAGSCISPARSAGLGFACAAQVLTRIRCA